METQPKRKFFIFRWIDHTSEAGGIVAALCLLAVTLIITYEVFVRYVFSAPTSWVAEFSIYLSMALGLLGAAYALKYNSHFSISIVVDRLTEKNRRRLKIVTHLMGTAYSLVFVCKGLEMPSSPMTSRTPARACCSFPCGFHGPSSPSGGFC